MQRRTWVWAVFVCAGAVLLIGCGKPTLPGNQFQGPRAVVPGLVATDTPLPEKPFKEWGPQDAKVRLLAFLPIDEPHEKVMDLVKEMAEKYPGKVYAKYVDYRTPEGAQLFQHSGARTACLMINGQSSAEVPSKYGPRTVDFVKDMGRYWTADDLREAVANEVQKAYGTGAGAGG
jgi:hypothetical protein